MSVCFFLYEPVHEEKKYGRYYELSSQEQREIDEKFNKLCRQQNFQDIDDFFDLYYKSYFTNEDKYKRNSYEEDDEITLDIIDLIKYKSFKKRNKRYRKYIDYMKKSMKNFIHYNNVSGYYNPYITVNEICYRQGWYLTKKFFNKSETTFFAFTKQDMIRLIKLYVKTDYWNEFDEFINKFKEGMIFEISW